MTAEGIKIPGFCGAFFHGSTTWLPDGATLPATSDLDVMVVLDGPGQRDRIGKFVYRDILLEVSTISRERLDSPERVLGDYHLAGSFRRPGLILDPSGRLARVQAGVSGEYARRKWVAERCEHAGRNLLYHLGSLDESAPLHDQVMAWLFGAGITTHVLLVAGLKNPTVRSRYVAARELLREYDHSGFYEPLLELLGCVRVSRAQAEQHLAALAAVFDAADGEVKSPFPFASDISDVARPIAIDGSRDLIERGDHREAMFWMLVTYSRCQVVLYRDAPVAMQERFSPGYRRLLGDVGIGSSADLVRRVQQIRDLLPRVEEVAQAIMAANPEIKD